MTQKTQCSEENVFPSLLELKNVTVVRSGKIILDSVSLSIAQGEHVAIIGPNGSGKSSLIKTFTKEYHPLAATEGLALKIMGKETWHVFELRNLLGIVWLKRGNYFLSS